MTFASNIICVTALSSFLLPCHGASDFFILYFIFSRLDLSRPFAKAVGDALRRRSHWFHDWWHRLWLVLVGIVLRTSFDINQSFGQKKVEEGKQQLETEDTKRAAWI
jgi:hypothetical protein